jgi:glucose-6-phosphate isomerase
MVLFLIAFAFAFGSVTTVMVGQRNEAVLAHTSSTEPALVGGEHDKSPALWGTAGHEGRRFARIVSWVLMTYEKRLSYFLNLLQQRGVDFFEMFGFSARHTLFLLVQAL